MALNSARGLSNINFLREKETDCTLMMLINFPILDALLTNFSVVINNCITKDRLSQPLVIKMSNMIVVNK